MSPELSLGQARGHKCPFPYSFLSLLPSLSHSEPLTKVQQELGNLPNFKEGPGMRQPLPPD